MTMVIVALNNDVFNGDDCGFAALHSSRTGPSYPRPLSDFAAVESIATQYDHWVTETGRLEYC